MTRQEFEMSEEDLAALLDACKPYLVLFLSGGLPMCATAKENANRAWERLGDKLGFNSMTVQPLSAKGQKFFTAEPRPAP